MKPYGVKHIGSVCKYGCCYIQTTQTGPKRENRHGSRRVNKKRARRSGRRECRQESE